MPATIAAARAGVTTGEWADVLREVFGEYRAPTGVGGVQRGSVRLADVAARCRETPGGPPRLLVAKPGLDGHSNGAEQIAVAARDAGMEVIYEGIRVTPAQIAATARDEDVDVVGLSILSGSHLELVPEVIDLLRREGVDAPSSSGASSPPTTSPSCSRRAWPPSTPRRTTRSPTSWRSSPSWWPPDDIRRDDVPPTPDRARRCRCRCPDRRARPLLGGGHGGRGRRGVGATAQRVRAVEGGGDVSASPFGPLPLAVLAAAAGLTGLVAALGPAWGVAAAVVLVVTFVLLGGDLS